MITDRSAVYRPVAFTGLVVVFYLGKVICLRVVGQVWRNVLEANLNIKNP